MKGLDFKAIIAFNFYSKKKRKKVSYIAVKSLLFSEQPYLKNSENN
jgi:hypothetical protein